MVFIELSLFYGDEMERIIQHTYRDEKYTQNFVTQS